MNHVAMNHEAMIHEEEFLQKFWDNQILLNIYMLTVTDQTV